MADDGLTWDGIDNVATDLIDLKVRLAATDAILSGLVRALIPKDGRAAILQDANDQRVELFEACEISNDCADEFVLNVGRILGVESPPETGKES